jgi:hypothetical protein
MKHPLVYPEVEFAYIIHKIKGHYKFETVEEVKNVLCFDIRQTKGFTELPDDKKEMAERRIIGFINGWGLEARDTLYPISVSIEPEEKRFKFYYLRDKRREKNLSYLYFDGGVA